MASCCAAACFPDVWTPAFVNSGIDDVGAECHRTHVKLASGLAGRRRGSRGLAWPLH
uniref:Uncharacterized protein n=1 Tax=Ralstonia solanacearum TaxID=305 RepID=A0A0S4TMG1_RALSL|nr:protein of unknown function [Ralstonia solanacearum]